METTSEKKPRKAGKRSPGYPMIGLQEAIERAKILWEKDKNNTIPMESAYEHLGYKSKGGYGARIIAALKKFELISENKSGIKLTSDAVDLMLHDPSDGHYTDVVLKLFLKPGIYERLYNEYDAQIPSDSTLRVKLIKDYGFNPDSVEDFIDGFKKTVEFAWLAEERQGPHERTDQPDSKPTGGDSLMQKVDSPIPEKTQSLPGLVFPIPLSKRKQAAIAFESLPVEKKDIAAIKAWLELFSDSLTETEES